jgi:futalosine hydrolase
MENIDKLVLVPTEFERKKIRQILARNSNDDVKEVPISLCGFGPISAAARTMQLLANQAPQQVVLIGIAGTYHQYSGRHPVGSATEFDNVICDGIGVDSEDQFQSAATLGWHQWAGEGDNRKIGDSIALKNQVGNEASESCDLLTVCSGSARQAQAKRRFERYPTIVGEDMEAFGVAMACKMLGLQLRVIRGFSNLAGGRDKTNWRIDDALEAASEILLKE